MNSEKRFYTFKRFLTVRKYLRAFQNKISLFNLPEYTTFSIYAIAIGAIVGFAAVGFHHSIEYLNNLFFEKTVEDFFFLGAATVILLPAFGMLLQSIMIMIAPETSKKRGVGEVIKAVALRGGFISFRTTLFHFIAPVISIGTGNTVGPEGPAAQLGGGVASKVANLIGSSDSRRRMFTAAGAGAAISAIFNSPMGGIFFALEIILLNDFHAPTFSALILASVTASAISRIFLGNISVFVFETPQIGSYADFYFYIILGVLAGILSILFIKYSNSINNIIKALLAKSIPQWLIMVTAGLFVGVSGYFFEEIFGFGYSAINKILANSLTVQVVLVLLILKFLLVPLVLNSGGFGGIFAPSLFMGACLGFSFVYGLNSIWGLNLDSTIFVLVGMGAVLGGVNSIPISAILIIFEMTKDYSFILPLMLAVVISTMLVQLVLRGSIHTKHLEQEGFNISSGRETNILRSLTVEDAMSTNILTIQENTPLPKLVSLFMESNTSQCYTVDENGKLSGVISQNELRPIIQEYDNLKHFMVAKDLSNPNIAKVSANMDLDSVMSRFSKENRDEFPVASADDPDILVGVISRQNVIDAYNKESFKMNLADGLSEELKTISKNKIASVSDGYSIYEKAAPDVFIGKTLGELRLRNKYGLEVLMIKKESGDVFDKDSKTEINIPDANYIIEKGDLLVLFGKDEKLHKFAEL
jgi:CIC family chloride channel protein